MCGKNKQKVLSQWKLSYLQRFLVSPCADWHFPKLFLSFYLSMNCCRNIISQRRDKRPFTLPDSFLPFTFSTLQSSKDLIRMNWIKWDLESFFSIIIISFSWICIQNTTGAEHCSNALRLDWYARRRGQVKELCFSNERLQMLQKDVYF